MTRMARKWSRKLSQRWLVVNSDSKHKVFELDSEPAFPGLLIVAPMLPLEDLFAEISNIA